MSATQDMQLGTGPNNPAPHNYDRASCYEQGHWFIREADKALFIVPDDRHGLAETYGPDDTTLDALNDFYRKAEEDRRLDWFDYVDTEGLCQQLGLALAHHWQRRFDPTTGWHTV